MGEVTWKPRAVQIEPVQGTERQAMAGIVVEWVIDMAQYLEKQ
jgi:hypothetical protein